MNKKRNVYLLKKYGITEEDYNTLFREQGGVCAVCRCISKRTLAVDHIHIKDFKKLPNNEKVNYIRGLVCFICNTAIGKLERRKTGNRQILTGLNCYFLKYKLKGEC